MNDVEQLIIKRLDVIETKIDAIQEFRWRLVGQISVMAFATSALTTVIMQLIVRKFI